MHMVLSAFASEHTIMLLYALVLRDFVYEYTIIAAMRMGFKPFCILGNVFAVMHAPLTLISPGSCVYIHMVTYLGAFSGFPHM